MGSPRNKQTSEKQTQTKRRHEFDREQVGICGRESGRLFNYIIAFKIKEIFFMKKYFPLSCRLFTTSFWFSC